MKARIVGYLACPDCEGGLILASDKVDGSEIIRGSLRCSRCSHVYVIQGGIPRLLPQTLSPEKRRTAQAFGWQWRHFVEMHAQYEAQFLDWIWPIEPAFFKDKFVLDGGCGIGRHAYFAAGYGAREVVGMDLSDAVETAYRVIGHLPNAHVVQGDIYSPPFRPASDGGPFDFVYAIGVLHHLPNPEVGLRALARCLRPGGTLFGWVYGYENTAVVRHVVDPFRRYVTTKLPPSLLRAVAWPLAAILHSAVRGVYGPLRSTAVHRRLPAHEYLSSLATFNFRQNYNIVFDHLVAPTAFYLKRDEFETWFHNVGLEGVELSWRNRNSWRGRGRVPARAL